MRKLYLSFFIIVTFAFHFGLCEKLTEVDFINFLLDKGYYDLVLYEIDQIKDDQILENYQIQFCKAISLFHLKKIKQAIPIFERLISYLERKEDKKKALIYLGKSYSLLNQVDKSVNIFSQILCEYPDIEEIKLLLRKDGLKSINKLLIEKDYKKALDILDLLLSFLKDDIELIELKINLLFKLGKIDEIEKIAQNIPQSDFTLFTLAQTSYIKGDFENSLYFLKNNYTICSTKTK